MSEWATWKILPIEDAVQEIIDYRGKSPRKSESGIPLITAKIVKNGRIDPPTEFIPASDYDEWMRRGLPKPGDVVITTEAPLGEVAQLGSKRVALAQRLIVLRAQPALMENSFLKYALQSSPVQHQLYARATGTTVLGIKQRELRKVRVPVPPLPTQRRIAHILGTLDDKIELNRRMNRTLEAIARAIFKSWFVDFDPVIDNALAAGKPIPEEFAGRAARRAQLTHGKSSPPENTRRLFLDEFQDSELGPIPKGWEIKALRDALSLEYGKALKASIRQPGSVPVYGSNGRVGWHNEALVSGPGIVVGRKGNPGTVTWVAEAFFPIDTTFYVVPADEPVSLRYLYHALRIQDLPALAADSAVPGLNRNIAYENKLVLPSVQLLGEFEGACTALAARVETNVGESRTLAQVRDALLPRLLSGQLLVAAMGEARADD